jgi:hypothetical protein
MIRISRGALACVLTALVATGISPASGLAQQPPPPGSIIGRAVEAKRPYSDYLVQLRNIDTGVVIATAPLDIDARYVFASVAPNQKYLVELYHVKANHIVCTEGPFGVATQGAGSKLAVDIDCGAPPALLWIILAGVGSATALGVASSSR